MGTQAVRGEAPVAKPGTVLAEVASERCRGCGRCVELCPTEGVTLGRDGRASVRAERGQACGLGVRECPRQAGAGEGGKTVEAGGNRALEAAWSLD
jgi:ferredoxin